MKMDKSKPYGEVYGESKVRYEQNGRFFDGAGNEVDGKGQPVQEQSNDKRGGK